MYWRVSDSGMRTPLAMAGVPGRAGQDLGPDDRQVVTWWPVKRPRQSYSGLGVVQCDRSVIVYSRQHHTIEKSTLM